MASMNNKERAIHYVERLKKATDKRKESKEIVNEINTLYWVSNNQPLSKEDKLSLIREIEELIKQKGRVSQEHYRKGEAIEEGFVVNASDNSELIDLIAAMKGSVK